MSTIKDPKNLKLRTFVMPDDLNHNGTLFGGRMLAWIDQAGACAAIERANSKVALLKLDNTVFEKPVFPADDVSFYAAVTKVGRTSLEVTLEVWRHNAYRNAEGEERAAIATCTYVALNAQLKPQAIDRK